MKSRFVDTKFPGKSGNWAGRDFLISEGIWPYCINKTPFVMNSSERECGNLKCIWSSPYLPSVICGPSHFLNSITAQAKKKILASLNWSEPTVGFLGLCFHSNKAYLISWSLLLKFISKVDFGHWHFKNSGRDKEDRGLKIVKSLSWAFCLTKA